MKKILFALLLFCTQTFAQGPVDYTAIVAEKNTLLEGISSANKTLSELASRLKTLDSIITAIPAVQPINYFGYNVADALPAGHKKDGSVDYTKYVQDAINKNDKIVFPGFPILVSDVGLKIGSNKILTGLPGSKLLVKPSALEGYKILNLTGSENVILNYMTVVGDAKTHLGKTGEWGQLINLARSKNIVLNNPNVTYGWGDGIYLGDANENITILNATSRYNRRDALSVISVDGLLIEGGVYGNSTGTDPKSGINFESNHNANDFKNVRVNNVRTESNGGYGLQVQCKGFYVAGSERKTIDILVNNHTSRTDNYAVKVAGVGENVYGQVTMNNTFFSKYTEGLFYTSSWNKKNFVVNLNNPKIQTAKGAMPAQSDMITLLKSRENIVSGSNVVISFPKSL